MKSNGAITADPTNENRLILETSEGLLSGRLPDDPAAFVAAAETITNRADAPGAASVYARDAVLESYTDGAYERHVGKPAITGAWSVYMSALGPQQLRLRKRLLSAADGVIVNEWTGEMAGGRPAAGIEYWIFNDRSEVRHHCMYSFLSVKPSTSWRQRLRMLLIYPRTALAFDRAQRTDK